MVLGGISSDYLVALIISECIAIFTIFAIGYINVKDVIFWESSTYFVLLSVLYVGIPACYHLMTWKTAIGASSHTIIYSGKYSSFFLFCLIIFFSIKILILRKSKNNKKRSIKVAAIDTKIIYLLYLLIITYILFAFIADYPSIKLLWTYRGKASLFSTEFNEKYKVTLLFFLIVSMVIYMSIIRNSISYIFLLTPFVVLNLLTTDRSFMYQSLLVWIFLLLINKKRIPLFKLIAAGLFIAFFEVTRTVLNTGLSIDNFFIIPGELLYSSESGLLILESNDSVNIFNYIIFSFGKIFTPKIMSLIFDNNPHFRQIINDNNPLMLGLGGSLLSEVYSFKSDIGLFIYPIVIVTYLEIINYLRKNAGIYGLMIFIFYLMSTISFFRGGLIFCSFDPLYYLIYAFVWYWPLSLYFKRKRIIQI